MRRLMLVWAAVIVLSGCAAVHVSFPSGEVGKAADLLVADAFAGIKAKGLRGGPGATQAAMTLSATPTMSAETIRLMESILYRFDSLKPGFDAGRLGLGADGLIVLRDPAKAGPDLQGLAVRDNADRRALYKAVAADLKIPETEIPKIAQIYADSWRTKAASGWWFADGAGNWTQKP